MKSQGVKYILFGFVLVIFGAVAPFVMVLKLVNNSFWLSIAAYSATVIGLFLGMFGALDININKLDE